MIKKFEIVPTKSVGRLEFGRVRDAVRSEFGNNFKEIRKNIFSKNTMDVYDGFHVYYSIDNRFEAIELFGDIQVIVNGEMVFPGKIENITKMFPHIINGDYGWIDKSNSLAVTISQDDETVIESIIFGKEDYFG